MFSSIKSFFGGGDAPAQTSSAARVPRQLNNPAPAGPTSLWCGPCRQLGPQLDLVANRNADKLRVVKVDMDQAPHLGQRFRVTGLPTVVLFKGGKEVSRFMGVKHERQIQAFVDPFLGQ
ncbi:thioredoxin-like protein [Catenaria anguillulae PL171]|uniref:Thioredoxin-like protein n=1 Tax=Catenaria anguillulae PL171 TaxID=765915 RepID=A0A1Y2I3D9_9FUNG|nr:thioredoxin-like protein [Catenaria anguillulae PL171]